MERVDDNITVSSFKVIPKGQRVIPNGKKKAPLYLCRLDVTILESLEEVDNLLKIY